MRSQRLRCIMRQCTIGFGQSPDPKMVKHNVHVRPTTATRCDPAHPDTVHSTSNATCHGQAQGRMRSEQLFTQTPSPQFDRGVYCCLRGARFDQMSLGLGCRRSFHRLLHSSCVAESVNGFVERVGI